MSDRDLHVFSNDVTDWVVASDPDDAVKVYTDVTGIPYDPNEDGLFTQEPDDKELCIEEEETYEPQPLPSGGTIIKQGDGFHIYSATMRSWADARGKCFLASTEY